MSALVAVLAGGRGRRMGGRKAVASYGGEPLIARPLAAAAAAGLDAVVVAKRDTALPDLDVPVWVEPDEPFHPLLGIVTALARASGRLAPFPARYDPAHLPALAREAPLRETLAGLAPATLAITDARLVASIDTAEELASA